MSEAGKGLEKKNFHLEVGGNGWKGALGNHGEIGDRKHSEPGREEKKPPVYNRITLTEMSTESTGKHPCISGPCLLQNLWGGWDRKRIRERVNLLPAFYFFF